MTKNFAFKIDCCVRILSLINVPLLNRKSGIEPTIYSFTDDSWRLVLFSKFIENKGEVSQFIENKGEVN
jgi:hypothetical protein